MINWKNFFYGFILVNVLWLLAAYMMNATVLPMPLLVYRNIGRLFLEHQMWRHMVYSLFRIFSGIFLSVLFGLIFGLIAAQSKIGGKILNPFIYFTYPIPKIALLPAVMLLFGLGEVSKILMIVLIIVFQMAINVRDGIRSIPDENYYILRCLGASTWRLFKEVTLPAALSQILSSTRVALGTAMSILFITETFGTRFGMGFYIMDAWMRINYIDMYGGIVVLSFVGFVLFLLVDVLESIFLRWQNI